MARTYTKQAAAYHGVGNIRYALRSNGTPGTEVKEMPYVKAMSYDTQVETTAVHANNRQILALVSDNGYTGNIGTTAPDREFEKSIGIAMEVAPGYANVKQLAAARIDLYYEYKETIEGGPTYTVKVWALNVEIVKPSMNNETDTTTPTIGEYQYPITVYGEKILSADGSSTYRDENGNEYTALLISALPGDDGYATFDSAVPSPTMPTAAP